ncbi:MAG: transporter substrate-binding domain-containing protein [Ruminococcus sp.]|jgi:polar amino acid transport system substrate-binding protein|nr:transporter substrate-binding domain-containing protein [Ruminococcus sp.]
MKRLIKPVLAMLIILSCLTGCVNKADIGSTNSGASKTYTDFMGSEFVGAIQAGEVYDTIMEEQLGTKRINQFDSVTDMLNAVDLGKIDFGVMASDSIYSHTVSGEYKNLAFTFLPPEMFTSKNAQIFHTRELADEFDEFIDTLIKSGELADIINFWLAGELPDAKDIPVITGSEENGEIIFAASAGYAPMYYLGEDGKMVGFNREMSERFAAYLGKKPVFVDMNYAAILPYVSSGKADMSACCFGLTEDREDSDAIFSKPYMSCYAAVAYKSDSPTEPTDNVYGVMNADGGYDIYNLPGETEVESEDPLTWEDFKGKNLSMVVGFGYDPFVREHFESQNVVYFQDYPLMLQALRNGKTDGAFVDYTAAAIYEEGIPELTFVPVPEEFFSSPMGFVCSDPVLLEQFNVFLAEKYADGTMTELYEKWMVSVPNSSTPMPEIENKDDPDPIIFYLSELTLPFTYIGENNEVKGYDSELLILFANSIGRGVLITPVEFNAILPAVQSGKADFGAAGISITAEREQMVDFSDPTFTDTLALMVRDPDFTNDPENTTGKPYNPDNLTIEDIMGGTFAVRLGSVYDELVTDKFDPSKVERFQDNASAYEAVSQGKIDYAVYDSFISLEATKQYEDFAYFMVPDEYFSVADGYVVNLSDTALADELNAFIADINANGVFAEMSARWLSQDFDADTTVIPEINLDDNTGELLRVAADATSQPFSYVIGNNVSTGFDIEFILRFAEATNRKIEITNMSFDALLPSIQSGKYDVAIGLITITEERSKSVLFTDPVYYERSGVVYKMKSAETVPENGFITYIKDAVNRNLIEDGRYKLIIRGLIVTMIITVSSMFAGTLLGGITAYFLTRKNRYAKRAAKLVAGLINGLPTVTLLMVAYYIIFGSSQINNVIIAVATFSVIMGIRIGEILAGAIETIDKTEIEAARASGFTAFGAFRTVTLPQAVNRALSPYLTSFVSLMKETAIVGYVAIQDLMRASDIIRSRTYDAYFPLLFAAFIYLTVTTIFILLFKAIIKTAGKKTAQ